MARYLGVPHADKVPYYFISYNSEDEARVKPYAAALASLAIPMWYDNGIKTGAEWEVEIAHRIDTCQAVIAFLSKNIFQKENSYVHKEFELATEYSRKPVYVVMLDCIEKPEVPVRFRSWWTDVTRLQCVNAYEYASAEECARRLVESAGMRASEVTVSEKETKPVLQTTKRIEYTNGAVYVGEVSEKGKPHGKGKMTWESGAVYEGDFVDGNMHGRGKHIRADGTSYEGDFAERNYHGHGKRTWPSGATYEGDFVNGKLHGRGRYTWPDGDVYEGDFQNGTIEGRGKLTRADGTVYEGRFVGGNYQGN